MMMFKKYWIQTLLCHEDMNLEGFAWNFKQKFSSKIFPIQNGPQVLQNGEILPKLFVEHFLKAHDLHQKCTMYHKEIHT